MKRLYFIRHGQSTANVLRQFAGQTDVTLTDQGRAEAAQAISTIKDLNIDLIVASPLVRALETAQIIAEGINYPINQIMTEKLFMEHDVGALAGHSWDEFGEYDSSFAGMENLETFRARIERGLEFIKRRPQENILLVGHGAYYVQLVDMLGKTPEKNLHHDANAGEPNNATVIQLI